MPYLVHSKDVHPTGTDYAGCIVFDNRAEAYAQKSPYTVVTFIASEDEVTSWRQREWNRLRANHMLAVPFPVSSKYTDHYVHLSVDTPGMLAYTKDIESGIQDRQTRIKPGRYLTQFYADIFDTAQIAMYVSRCTAVQTNLKLATTEEDVVAVYMFGPPSCMDAKHFAEMPVQTHPAAVYAAPSDLAVAYYGDLEAKQVSQRCIVWPKTKHYTRIYGTGPLENLLAVAGYSRGSIDGARVRKIACRHGLLMPYVDSHHSVSGSPDAMYVDPGGSQTLTLYSGGCGYLECSETCGYVSTDTEDNDRDDMASCEHCGCDFPVDDDSAPYCYRCYEESWSCDACSRIQFGSPITVGNAYFCQSCADNVTQTCQDDHCSHTWIPENEFTPEEIVTRIAHNLDDLCRSCASRYSYCEHCEVAYDDTDPVECPDCHRPPRCEKTPDLFTSVYDVAMLRFVESEETESEVRDAV